MAFSVVAAVASGLALVIIGAVVFPVYNFVLHNELKQIIPLHNKTESLAPWEHPVQTSDAWIKFYVFHVANPDDVLNGAKPLLQERGPYVYTAAKVKEDVIFHTNGTVEYRPVRTMVFIPGLSSGHENDTFTTINVPLYTIMTFLKHHPALAVLFDVAKQLIKDTTIFRTLTVHQIIWGYKDPLLVRAAELLKHLPLKLPIKIDGYFGFFYKKNNTDTGLFNIYTGVDNLQNYMTITRWNRYDKVPFWTADSCNMINGTDGQNFHPFVDVNAKLYIFVPDICRSIYLRHTKKVVLENVPLYRFSPTPDLFTYEDSPENFCFCTGGTCPMTGALNISSCQGGAPVFVSLPHFLQADYYGQQVLGLTPHYDKHVTYLDVEQTLGVVMEGSERLQLNLAVERIPYIPATKHMPSLLFPVIWLDQAAKINSVGMAKFKRSFFYLQNGITVGAICLIVMGCLLLAVAVVVFTIRRYRKRKQKPISVASDETTPLVNEPNDTEDRAQA